MSDLDTVTWCRDEMCGRVELHAAHGPVQHRGRTPRSCPACLQLVEDGKCTSCGWVRARVPPPPADVQLPSASAWAPCPAHEAHRVVCSLCGNLGVVPRLRLSLLFADRSAKDSSWRRRERRQRPAPTAARSAPARAPARALA